MKCANCQSENREGIKFCEQCGAKMELECPNCKAKILPGNKFCGECGQRLEDEAALKDSSLPLIESERKHVTVLFSDLSGYTAMSERLDPEEVKEIMGRIFGEISQVVTKYEGFIEKFVGDAVMALFGVPRTHEDDPIRAIKAAREIHKIISSISPQYEKRIGKPLAMHTGISTGLVVTGEVNLEKGTHGVLGDTMNIGSRLSGLARPGEILVSPDTYRQAEGHFTFDILEPTTIKGKADPVPLYKVLQAKARPITIHRLSGRRAELIGRSAEVSELSEAVNNLRKGKGKIFSILGDAGTGKSRLVEDFKTTLDLKEIQWLEGHAYAYSQNIPYFPLIDLLNRVFQIEEGDRPENVKGKIESGVEHLLGKKEELVPYIGSLYSLPYPEVEDVSPEFWRSRLKEIVQTTLTALAKRSLTIFLLEDLHWADPSFAELLRQALLEIRQPAIVLCVYRPPFSLFTSHQLSSISKIYQEIRLQDLSLSEAQDMLKSLLKTESLPSDLKRFVQDKAEGNPFYLEELANSLIESETLIRDNGRWKITKTITESDISSTIHGLISGRVDRLEKETKRILQEASVIGRVFLYKILRGITELEESIDRGLSTLEKLDFIRTRSLQPELEYMFKHPLTQEVVYNSLLKKERHKIHEQIALVMEQLFQDRLPEFYEIIAFHYNQGRAIHRAIEYLTKSGDKSLKRYAVEESHQYYKEAFGILTNKPDKSMEEESLLIDILIKWTDVFYCRGDFTRLEDLLSAHEVLAESLMDKTRLGMLYTRLGIALMSGREKYKESYRYLSRALKLGEEIGNPEIVSRACAQLSWTCAEMGLLDEAILFGARAQDMFRVFELDHFLYWLSLSGIGEAYFHKGEPKNALRIGKALLDHGEKHSDIRSLVWGHWTMGWSHFTEGDFSSAINCFQRAIQISADPYFSQFPRLGLGYSYVSSGQFGKAELHLQEVLAFCQQFGVEIIETPARGLLALILIGKGHLSRGIRMMEKIQRVWLQKQRRPLYAASEYVLGKVYLELIQKTSPKSLSFLIKNIIFLVKEVPFAWKKAEFHLKKAIDVAREVGAKSTLGTAYLDLGLLYKTRGKKDKARECISEAVHLFEQCEAEVYLKQAKEALAALE
jgi:class 3 adenylate cyclase/tetratricopeptide (TPR) repeat protein